MGIPWLLTRLCKTSILPLHSHGWVGLPVVIKAAVITETNATVFKPGMVVEECNYK